jgi:RHS repeat-associated protein
VTDSVVVINRAVSSFGAGWWLDGLENLVTLSDARMLWVGGDGTTRLYTRSSDPNVYTVTPAYDRPDTLRRVQSSPETWHRLMGDNAYVEFNSAGQHVETVNSLGWRTKFLYTGALLDSIVLPVPASSSEVRGYRFWYTSSLLDSVQAPSASLARTVRVDRGGTSKINSIIDPDGFATAFGYDASNRLTTRRNKLNDTSYFQYDDGGALKQSSLSIARTDATDSAITTNFRSAETRSVYSTTDLPTIPQNVYTQLDGPRTDVEDTTNILINRWGAPDSVTNTLGQKTRISRANATFPALVTNVIAPNGFETRAFFNSRALTDSTVAVDPFNTGANSTTRFAWNPVWNQPDSVIGPTGERTRTFYQSTRPIVDSMRMGTNTARRVRFAYTADNQVRSVTEPGSLPDSVMYDALGNATRAWTPMGRSASVPYFTESSKDAIGRDTLVIHPISGDTTGSTRIIYDVADRVVQTVSYGPARPYSLPLNVSFAPDTATIEALTRTDSSGYDAEGRLTFKRALSSSGDVQVNERFQYDAAGRLRKRLVGTGPDSMVYDPAGNLTRARYRSSAWVTQSYDALNRIITRSVPGIKYGIERCRNFSAGPISDRTDSPPGCQMIFPYYTNAGDSLSGPPDTQQFAYDLTGNLISASNLFARVRRTYYRGGALKTDSTGIGDYTSPLVDDTRGQQYAYDLSGRRTSMEWQMGPTSYTYNDFGALSTVTDAASNQYRITYTLAGQVDSLLLGTGVSEKREYDDDGRLKFRNRMSSGTLGLLVRDSLKYDHMNRIIRAWEEVHQQSADQTLISYDGLGAVLAREQGGPFGSSVEEFRNDAFGNVLRRMNRKSAGLINNAPFVMQYSPTGELRSSVAQPSNPPGIYQRQDELKQAFSNGRLIRQDEIERDPNTGDVTLELAAWHYYTADDKLGVVQRYSYHSPDYKDGTWEEYRYDALGRRIMTRVRRSDSKPISDSSLTQPLCQSTTVTTLCRSYIERVWWDGDQALVEERSGYGGVTDPSNSGRVGNIHGLTLDEPLAVITPWMGETRIINYNWRGQALSSVFPNGQGGDYSTGNASAEIDWPAATQSETYFTPAPTTNTSNNPKWWLGTFVANGQGTAGMLYRRNRYFDTKSGRFTQEDPIGIAGGLNTYGFAEGDPINFSDPFGFCTPWPDCALQQAANWGAHRSGAIGPAVLNISALANATSEALGINDFGRAVAERDAVGIGIGIASILPIGRAGTVGKTALSTLMKDATKNPKAWRTVGAFVEAAVNRKAKGGVSIQTILENDAGDRLVRHTILDKAGKILDEHFRDFIKPYREIP